MLGVLVQLALVPPLHLRPTSTTSESLHAILFVYSENLELAVSHSTKHTVAPLFRNAHLRPPEDPGRARVCPRPGIQSIFRRDLLQHFGACLHDIE